MRKINRLFMCIALMGLASPAVAQDNAGAASAEPAASSNDGSGVTASTRERIGRVNGISTTQNTKTFKNSSGSEARTHLVVDGDTLWNISETYLQDPFMWPALWSYNPQVTNPHWIYPGDIIYLEPYQPGLVADDVPMSEDAPLVQITPGAGRGVVGVPGLYMSEIPETKGHILFSDQEKHMLTLGDEVQVDWADIEMRKKISRGQRFVVFTEANAVRDADGNDMAYKLIRAGVVEIIDPQTETLSTARIVSAYREIERGDMILPAMDLSYAVNKKANSKNMEGRIIDTIEKNSQLGEQQYVILNRGQEDGVELGNTFVIFEQREGLERLPEGEDTNTKYASENDKKDEDDEDRDPRDGEIEREDEHTWVLGRETRAPEFPARKDLSDIYGDRDYTTADLPLRKIGEVLVINVQDKFSTGIILDNSREIEIDTRVVMIKGQ